MHSVECYSKCTILAECGNGGKRFFNPDLFHDGWFVETQYFASQVNNYIRKILRLYKITFNKNRRIYLFIRVISYNPSSFFRKGSLVRIFRTLWNLVQVVVCHFGVLGKSVQVVVCYFRALGNPKRPIDIPSEPLESMTDPSGTPSKYSESINGTSGTDSYCSDAPNKRMNTLS